MGYWKKVGLDMSFRWFQRGTDTAKAVITGDVQVGYTATPVAVNLIAAGAPHRHRRWHAQPGLDHRLGYCRT